MIFRGFWLDTRHWALEVHTRLSQLINSLLLKYISFNLLFVLPSVLGCLPQLIAVLKISVETFVIIR